MSFGSHGQAPLPPDSGYNTPLPRLPDGGYNTPPPLRLPDSGYYNQHGEGYSFSATSKDSTGCTRSSEKPPDSVSLGEPERPGGEVSNYEMRQCLKCRIEFIGKAVDVCFSMRHHMRVHNGVECTSPTSYWSVDEQKDFLVFLRHFGTDFTKISGALGTKTPTMVSACCTNSTVSVL